MVDMHEDDCYTLPETLRSIGLPNDIKMLQVTNDDMAPYVSRGDIVIYDPRVNSILSNGVYVLQIDDRFLVRRIQKGIRHSVRLICDNPLFDDEVLNELEFSASPQGEGVVVVGAVVGRLLLNS